MTDDAIIPEKAYVIRKYGLLKPINWDEDCSEHLYLQNKLWNRLVEIERENRTRYRAIVGADTNVAGINSQIDDIQARLLAMDNQRKELRKTRRAKSGIDTEPLDVAIRVAKAQLKELYAQAKEIRAAAKEREKTSSTALDEIEEQRLFLVKNAYNNSGLWWCNYNSVMAKYKRARSRAMKEGVELRFHRFDGSGRFTCQIQGNLSAGDLLSGRHNFVRLRLVDNATFAKIIGTNPPAEFLQVAGSRRDNKQYGILSITIYTGKDEDGANTRRYLEFPIVLHRPMPTNGSLKMVTVSRRKVGPDYRWSATLTFSSDLVIIENPSQLTCGVNLGWKQVKEGVRIATVYDNDGTTSHITLPQELVDRLTYADSNLKSRIDSATNENFAWLLDKLQMECLPQVMQEVILSLRRAKKPHPAMFAKAVVTWRENCDNFFPEMYAEAEKRRRAVKRLSLEYVHLRDKVLRRRTDFYQVIAGKLTAKYSLIALDKMDLRKMAALEKSDGTPSELHKKAQRLRTIAAVSEFRECLKKQSKKTGSVVKELTIKSTRTCHVCGYLMILNQSLDAQCGSCGTLSDKDVNAAANLLRVVLDVNSLNTT